MNSFEGKVVLVTGASRGIGAATAAAFAQGNAIVVANYPVQDAETHSRAIEQWRLERSIDKDRLIPIQADISNVAEVAQMFDAIKSQFGRLDILINNAGVSQDRTVSKMTDEQWHRVLRINLDGTFFSCRSAISLLPDGACIVNISSVVAHTGSFGVANYAASKAGVLALTKTLALELASRRIRVNAICPGYIDTNMTQSIPKEILDRILQQIPLKRRGSVEEIANCILFLASDQASYITGQSIGVNGGIYMGD